MRIKLVFLVLISISFIARLNAQNTVGLITYEPDQAFDGYNLFYPHNQPNVYLMNNCGEIVHVWEDDANWRPGNMAYLTEDGKLYKAKRDAAVAGDVIWAGGGAILEIRDWDNTLLWQFEMNDSINRLHHDFAVTAQGNIIALAWEYRSTEECLAAGRDTSTLAQGVMWPDWIFEIDPVNDSIVWEWRAWDHLVQDFDETKDNFGVIAEHPELIDVNFGRVDGHPDWMHGNSLDYNDELKQIMLSVPYFDEVWIIDHTTSTAEAASSQGGLSNRGGDLMWRWGNDSTYAAGNGLDQQLFFQHDAHWIDNYIESSHPLYGKMAVFNNQVGADFSTANILSPVWDMYNWSYGTQSGSFLPSDFDLTLTHPTPTELWSTGLSSIQVLPNGNFLLTSGRFGYTFELTPNNEIVWEYKTPLVAGNPASQGDMLAINNNLTFRMNRIPTDYPAFDGQNLSPMGWLELNPDTSFCDLIISTMDLLDESNFRVFPNPAQDFIAVEWDGMMQLDLEVYNLLGVQLHSYSCHSGRKYIDTSDWSNGVYLLSFQADGNRYSRKLVLQK